MGILLLDTDSNGLGTMNIIIAILMASGPTLVRKEVNLTEGDPVFIWWWRSGLLVPTAETHRKLNTLENHVVAALVLVEEKVARGVSRVQGETPSFVHKSKKVGENKEIHRERERERDMEKMSLRNREVWGLKSVKSFTGAMGSPIKRVWNVDQMGWDWLCNVRWCVSDARWQWGLLWLPDFPWVLPVSLVVTRVW